jgi:hypothetical protein
MADTADRVSIILSVNRALLGAVSSSLRSVQVEWNEKEIDLYCYFDGLISEDAAEDMSVVAAEVAADFPGHTVNDHCIRIDFPQKIIPTNAARLTIFRRKE